MLYNMGISKLPGCESIIRVKNLWKKDTFPDDLSSTPQATDQ